MTDRVRSDQLHSVPGVASAEDGLVVLDGPDGVALTMTPDAAAKTGQSLIAAAGIATRQATTREQDNQ